MLKERNIDQIINYKYSNSKLSSTWREDTYDCIFWDLHGEIDNNPLCHKYISPDIDVKLRKISRTNIVASKTNSS